MKEYACSETSGDDSSIHFNGDMYQNMSMAAESGFYPGSSLSDKLQLAAAEGHADHVLTLLHKGADFKPDREGRTAIHFAALNGYGNIVSLLSNAGCDIDARDNLGYTALHRAAAQGHLEVIHALLEEGCVLDRQDDVHGNAALHEAAWNGYSRTLEVLIKNKASVCVLNKAGFSALHLAAQNGHNQSGRVLLYAGCDPNLKNNYGDTALHTATRYGHAGVTRILVSARCHIDSQNKNSDTALHIASALKRRKIGKLLCEAGINTNIKNKQNETAADVARRKQHTEIVETILSQHKMLKEKKKQRKKSGKEKLMVQLPEHEEKKEKKGFFFRKRSKSKDKLKDNKQQSGSSIEVKEDEDIKPPIFAAKATSDASSRSSEFTSNTPQEMMKDYGTAPHVRARGTNTVQQKDARAGYLSQYMPRNGTQYYKDLAGNVKQGPIGYQPVCTCGPQMKKLEQKMDADRDNLYDHIGHTHKMITEQINKMDQRCAQQVYTLDKLTRERFDTERSEREHWMNDQLHRERHEWDRRHRTARNEVQFHVDTKMSAFEKKYGHARYCQGCDWCQRRRKGSRHATALDDDIINYSAAAAPAPGRLVRAHSDETLSVSSSHPSRRHWKVRSRAARKHQQHELMTDDLVRENARHIEQDLQRGKRSSPPGAAPQPIYQELGRPSGNSPDGAAAATDSMRTRPGPVNNGLARQFEEAEGKAAVVVAGTQQLQVHDKPPEQRAALVSQPSVVQMVSIGAVAEVHSPPYMPAMHNTPVSQVSSQFDSSINVDSPPPPVYQHGAYPVRGPVKITSSVVAYPAKQQQAREPAYNRQVAADWYDRKGAAPAANGRPAQPPLIGYGHQPSKHAMTVYSNNTRYQQNEPQQNAQQQQKQVYVPGKATEV